MTHDELLAEITLRQGMETGLHAFKAWLALRAVVELHNPKNFIVKNDEVVEQWCTADTNQLVPYPCPTIQAIEKGLQ